MKRVYVPGCFVSEEHVRKAWVRIRAGAKIELAAESVLPSSRRINSTTRSSYQNSLMSILALKRQLFALACEETKRGGDWRRVFRGRPSVYWPDLQERTELGLIDYTSHEFIVKEPYMGRPLKVRMVVDHQNRNVKEAVVVSLNGHSTG